MKDTNSAGDFLDGVSARVAEIIEDTKDMNPSFLSTGLFKTINSDALQYNTEGVSGLGLLQPFAENDSIPEDETYAQYKTEYVAKQYGEIVSISQLLANTRPADLENKLNEVKQLMIAANRSLDTHAWQVLNDGFSASDSVTGLPISRLSDGLSQFSTSHTSRVPNVAVRSNRLASNVVLSESNLFTAMKMLREMLNGRGQLMGYQGGFTLVIPPALEKLAQEITQSTLKSDTADNDLNFYTGTINTVVSNYLGAASGLGSDTQWFVFANDPMNLSLRYVPLLSPKVEQERDFDTKAQRVSIDGAWAFGYSNFEYGVASDGSAS